MIHADISVENTGNGSAFDILVTFDPPLTSGEAREGKDVPFQRLSLLKPGQALSSYLGNIGPYLEKRFEVTVSWVRTPSGVEREQISYVLDMRDFSGVTYLGERDPLAQIAREVKHIREDWRPVAAGNRRIEVDNFSSVDRAERERELDEWRNAQRVQRHSDGQAG